MDLEIFYLVSLYLVDKNSCCLYSAYFLVDTFLSPSQQTSLVEATICFKGGEKIEAQSSKMDCVLSHSNQVADLTRIYTPSHSPTRSQIKLSARNKVVRAKQFAEGDKKLVPE